MVVLFGQAELFAACVEVALNCRRIAGLPWRAHTDFHAGRFKSQQVLPRKGAGGKLMCVRCANPYIERSYSRVVYSFVTACRALKAALVSQILPLNDVHHRMVVDSFSNQSLEQKVGEVIRFIAKSESERARLIREARAIYRSIFPPTDPVSERWHNALVSDAVSRADACRSDGAFLS
jgi:hypothetical protein